MRKQKWVIPLLTLMTSPGGLADKIESLANDLTSDLPPIGHGFPEEQHPTVRKNVRYLVSDSQVFLFLLILSQFRGMTLTQAVSLKVPPLEGNDVSEEEQTERDRNFRTWRSRMTAKDRGIIPRLKGYYPLISTCYYGELEETEHVIWCKSYLKSETKSGTARDKKKPRKDEVVLISTILWDEVVASLEPHYRKLAEDLSKSFRN